MRIESVGSACARFAAVASVAVLTAASCSPAGEESPDDDQATASDAADEDGDAAEDATDEDGSASALSHSGRGPIPVGVRTLHLDDAGGDRVEVWYPADPEALSGLTPEIDSIVPYVDSRLLDVLPEEVADSFDTGAFRDAVPAAESFPVVIDSHALIEPGWSDDFIASHIASWGFVVLSVDRPVHPDVSFASLMRMHLHGSLNGLDATDIENALAAVESEMGDIADTSRIGVIGHGYSARASIALLALPQVSTGVFWSSTRDSEAWPNFTFPGGSKPVTLIGLGAGALAPERTVRSLHESLWGPRVYFAIEDAGANTMSDFCRRVWPHGDSMEAVASSFDELYFLHTTEGCGADFVDPDIAQAVLKHAVTVHFLRELTGEEIELEADFADASGGVVSDFERLPARESPRPTDLSKPGSYTVNTIVLRLPNEIFGRPLLPGGALLPQRRSAVTGELRRSLPRRRATTPARRFPRADKPIGSQRRVFRP